MKRNDHSESLTKQIETILVRYGAPHDHVRRMEYEMFLRQNLGDMNLAYQHLDLTWLSEKIDVLRAAIDKVWAESR